MASERPASGGRQSAGPDDHAGDTRPLPRILGGKYEVGEIIGSGGMAIVVAARHVALERAVAIKLIREELTTNRDAVRRFLREAKAVAKLASEHVCQVFDVGELDDGAPFIVMELLQGHDLQRVLQQRGTLPPAAAVGWLLQACKGVAEAHAHGIVHRDLKPENIFIARGADGSDRVKVLDFGVCRLVGPARALGDTRHTGLSLQVGSPRYMSPEQINGDDVDARSDVWSLGLLLYEMLTGESAFGDGPMERLFGRVLHEPPRPLPVELPAALCGIVQKCLQKAPEGRYASAAELAQALGGLRGLREPGLPTAPAEAAPAEAATESIGTRRVRPPEAVPDTGAAVDVRPSAEARELAAPAAGGEPPRPGWVPRAAVRMSVEGAARQGLPEARLTGEPQRNARTRARLRQASLAVAVVCSLLALAGWFTRPVAPTRPPGAAAGVAPAHPPSLAP